MAEWEKYELKTPEKFERISQNAQNAINNIDILLGIIKQAGDVAKLFLMLTNPAAIIIRLAAEEIIKLCNDFKEIGGFFLLVNPRDKQYANLSPARYGLKIKQDKDGLYLFEPSLVPDGPAGTVTPQTVGKAYQQTLQLSDLSTNYRDSFGRSEGDANFIPPRPIFDSPPEYELGGYDPLTWTGTADSVPKLENGAIAPQMTPSQVLSIMSGAFDDEGDVSKFEIDESDQIKYAALAAEKGRGEEVKDSSGNSFSPKRFESNSKAILKLYTADGAEIDYNTFDITLPQTERIFKKPSAEIGQRGFLESLTFEGREEITRHVSSGKPNFAGSSNITGVETIAIVALVGVTDYVQFVTAFKNLNKLFGGAPDLSKLYKEAQGLLDDSTAEGGDKLTLTNNTKYGSWKEGDFIRGKDSGATGQISKIVSTETQERTKLQSVKRYDEDRREIGSFPERVDLNPDGNWKKVEVLYKKLGEQTKNFQAGETIFEALRITDKEFARAIANGDDSQTPTYNYIKKEKTGSALGTSILAKNTDPADVPTYGEVLGIDTSYPESTHPNFSSFKIKDFIPGYAGFFDEIIQFAENLKSYADKAEAFAAILIKMIDKEIKYFEKIANQIKEFLQLFITGLPEGGIYWLTIKTYGGNKSIQKAITSSDNPPPDNLKFSAGFVMVSVSGMGGSSATKNLEGIFSGLGLNFQEVDPIPDETEFEAAVQIGKDAYAAAEEKSRELITTIRDVSGLNPPVLYRDATFITFTDWNGVEPIIGDYVLGEKSGCFGQILAFSELNNVLILDHIKPGPTIAGTQVSENRIVRILGPAGDELEFPYSGLTVSASNPAYVVELPATELTNAITNEGVNLVGEGRFTEQVLVDRSSHKGNGQGTTVYDVFQGNQNSFVRREDTEELVSTTEFTLTASQSWNTFGSDVTIKQQIFKVIDNSVKTPNLVSGFNGKYGYFTNDDTIISFGEESAQTFLADIEGRNAEDDKVTRSKPPPLHTKDNSFEMKITVDGRIQASEDGDGEVESYAAALDNELNPNNLTKIGFD
jgi:hypothetical protein